MCYSNISPGMGMEEGAAPLQWILQAGSAILTPIFKALGTGENIEFTPPFSSCWKDIELRPLIYIYSQF